MEENIMAEQPNSAEISGECEKVTTPGTKQDKPQLITLKFNKEIREVPLDEAVALAQKGLKFDKILPEFEQIKHLANKKGLAIGELIAEIEKGEELKRREQLLESSGGNQELTEHILNLERDKNNSFDSFNLLKKEFPDIDSKEKLPSEVLENLELFGGNALSAYLLYLHRQNRLIAENNLKQQENRMSALGSQAKNSPENKNINEEFIKGIWS